MELLAQFAEPTEAPDDLPDAHKDLLIFMSIFDAMNAKPKFRQLVTLLKKVAVEDHIIRMVSHHRLTRKIAHKNSPVLSPLTRSS